MPLPVITDCFLVQAMFQRPDGDPVGNAFCFRNDSGEQDPSQMAGRLRDLMDSFYGDGVSSTEGVGYVLSDRLYGLRYTVYDLGNQAGGAFELPSLTYRATAATAAAVMPPDCAVTVSWQTEKRGPSFRGRTYLGPLKTSLLASDGRVGTSNLNTVVTHCQKLIGVSLSRDAHLLVLSRTKGLVTDVTGGYIDHEFDTQRRRGFVAAPRTSFGPPLT